MSDMNAVGDWNSGWTFYNKINNPDAIIEFPNTGYASSTRVDSYTYYWEATPVNEKYAYSLIIELYSMGPTSQSGRAARGSIRPAVEKYSGLCCIDPFRPTLYDIWSVGRLFSACCKVSRFPSCGRYQKHCFWTIRDLG